METVIQINFTKLQIRTLLVRSCILNCNGRVELTIPCCYNRTETIETLDSSEYYPIFSSTPSKIIENIAKCYYSRFKLVN